MKHVIPSELYKNVYLTLFESHLSYGITAWGEISKNLLQPKIGNKLNVHSN